VCRRTWSEGPITHSLGVEGARPAFFTVKTNRQGRRFFGFYQIKRGKFSVTKHVGLTYGKRGKGQLSRKKQLVGDIILEKKLEGGKKGRNGAKLKPRGKQTEGRGGGGLLADLQMERGFRRQYYFPPGNSGEPGINQTPTVVGRHDLGGR